MPRFNPPVGVKERVRNLAKAEAFAETPDLELVGILLTSFVQDQYYRSADDTLDKLRELLPKVDTRFAAQSAIYARRKYGMRSITHVLAGEIGQAVKGLSTAEWAGFFQDVVFRPDDITEIINYFRSKHGKSLPNAMKKGFARKLITFDSYQVAKYRGQTRSMKLVDALRLCHPQPTDALMGLVRDTLTTKGEGWSAALTEAGEQETEEDKATARAESWETLLAENKLGHFALLRNLRNIIKDSPSILPVALAQLTDRNRIKNSKVLPFRYLTALANLGEAPPMVVSSLYRAMEISLDNVPDLPGKTLVAIDVSGSMDSNSLGGPTPRRKNAPIITQPKVIDVACLFGSVLFRKLDADVVTFSQGAAWPELGKDTDLITLSKQISDSQHHSGTNLHCIFEAASKAYDRVVILSDMQAWIGYSSPELPFTQYCERYECRPKVYSFDLAGYGSLQFPQPDTYYLAGFSDKVFDLMGILEEDREALRREISQINF